MSMVKRVLVLCTGNSCRSQMAEGLINAELAGRWQAFSAGTSPSDNVHPLAVEAMAEVGIDIGDQEPKHVKSFRGQAFDVVITVCDNAARTCPAWLGEGMVKHIGFPDPADATGSKEERMAVFRAVRKGIRERVLGYLKALE